MQTVDAEQEHMAVAVLAVTVTVIAVGGGEAIADDRGPIGTISPFVITMN
jgi:hypothetical protein